MGLDNGIVVRGLSKENLPSFVNLAFDFTGADEIDLCYWRKCWGLRNEINKILHMGMEDYGSEIDKEDIPAILRAIKRYMNPTYWEENADSIWTWEEYFEHNLQQYINLTYLYEIWDDHPELKVEWYDSY